MLRRWFLFLALGVIVFIGAVPVISAVTSQLPVRPAVNSASLVVVSMPTLSWTDVSKARMPALWALSERGAVAALTTRDPSPHSCSNQSWLTFSAGAATPLGRSLGTASARSVSGPCPKPLVPHQNTDGSAYFPSWSSWRAQALRNERPSNIGLLGTMLAADRQCIAAAGTYSALGAANEDGVIAHYTAGTDNVDLGACPVTFIGLKGPDDAYLAALMKRLSKDATIVVVGIADDWKPETLHAVAMAGPGIPHGLLTSLSTRQPGFLQTTDLSALVLGRLGIAAPNLPEGRSPQVQPSLDPTGPTVEVTGLTRALNVEYHFVPGFFALFLGGGGLAVAIGLLWWRLARRKQVARSEPRRLTGPLRWWFAMIGAMCASMPMATFLVGMVPWWQASHPKAALSLAIIGVSAVLTALALLGPWRRWVAGPMTFLVAATLFVIAQDVVHGSRLQFISLMGLQPVQGGRYFGQGNVAYAVYATSALLLAALIAERLINTGYRRFAATSVAVIGFAVVFVDGFPSWGSDGGGPLAMIPAFAYLTFHAAGVSLTWKRLVATGVLTVAVVGSFAVMDYLRPPRYRTHLGNFVANMWGTGKLTGLTRIWTNNWGMLTSTWLNMTVIILVLGLVLFLAMPRLLDRPLRPMQSHVSFLRYGLTAVAICWLLAFLSNDSGTAIPPTGLLFLIPLLILQAATQKRPRPTAPDARIDVVAA